jgi:signal transduction histidine kinase
MSTDNQTQFAPAERSVPEEIKMSYSLLESEKVFLDAFGSVSGITAILDNNRQIIYANDGFLKLLGMDSLELILGRRPGEAVSCIHSTENINGCGTSEACSACGAVNSIIESQLTGQKSTREARITSEIQGKLLSWDLNITTIPVKIRDRIFYTFTVQDISSEKRKENLERIFFHDLLNSAGSLNGLLTILKDGTNPEEAEEIIKMSEETSRDMIDEIQLHRQIRAAENGDLEVKNEMLSSVELLKSSVGRIEGNEVALEKRIIIVDHSEDVDLVTDRKILQRILINMLKNALEATGKGGTIYTAVENFDNKVRFTVKNDSVMDRDIQLQMFQRSFSTKGKGRGIGTYSIRLLTENYLKGKAGFTSTETEGTVFYIDLFKSKKDND